ncbi:amino acid/amide ABC transporter substrate-binding protein (HAAT family) [Hasllibacter halocynthiae]|uniref:Amino acid/amide ABC transporter substrate-binding protein (HAAT family) n=1 Tax=Hasllibacter halocynthiae TaxID=595589 RepID=A0A2T0X1Z1_9RHOB|nr:penicillin-binding protein activator [Hasllibacter halocynthiae]PRY92973.1 amino acid/amide ABC transporter substrate-binding protein (HAAT family) [Hasllibacter halocynthiae]
MIAVNTAARKASFPTRARRALALLALPLALAACGGPVGLAGPARDAGPVAPATVALLLPGGGGNEGQLSTDLERAARLALSEAGADAVTLEVFETGGTAAGARQAAQAAVAAGTPVILGPLFAQAANAAGVAAAPAGVNVLALSNNAAIAGGNVFILGQTFDDTARRLVSYGVSQGRDDILVVAPDNAVGRAGRQAVTTAASQAGARIAGVETFEFTQGGVVEAAPRIAQAAGGADTVFLTTDTAGALPLLVELLPQNGIAPPAQQYVGLTRWDIPPATLALPGVEGGWFALPDPGRDAAFRSRFAAAYGSEPHPLASVAYDGMRAIVAGLASGRGDALSAGTLTRGQGFEGATGPFRIRPDGTAERALAVATVRGGQVAVVDPAPARLGGGFF